MQGDSAVHTSLKILPVPRPKKPAADRIASAGGGREGGREGGMEGGMQAKRGRHAGRKREGGRKKEGGKRKGGGEREKQHVVGVIL